MGRRSGRVVLILSGMGFPLTQAAMRRFGRSGAFAVEAVTAALLMRDAGMIARGATGRLRRGPAMLLWLETASAALASVLSLRPLFAESARVAARAKRPTGGEALRRIAIGTLFGLHTMRFRIYLQPDQGRRQQAAENVG